MTGPDSRSPELSLSPEGQKLADEWSDEAAEAAKSGNPRRAFYLEHMAGRADTLIEEAAERANKGNYAFRGPTR